MISYWANTSSALPEETTKEEDEKFALRKVLGRDNGYKTFGRMCDTLSLIIY